MLRLTLLVLLACLIGIAVSYPTNDESTSDDHSNDQTQSSDDDSQSDDHSSDDSQDSADSSQETDNGLDLRNGTCLEKAERILKYLWEQYKLKHNINISPDEEKMRIAIFKELLERIQLQNGKAEMGQSTFEIGINAFSHLTPEEVNKMKGFISDQKRSSRNEFRASTPLPALPSSLDWRQYGWVTPVKNQGQCGSCYTFATTGCLEGQLFNRTNQLVSMSEQNLVDCSRGKRGTPNLGCNGGITDVAFEYVMKNGGIATEASYPYTAKLGKCKYATSMSAGGPNVIGFVDVQSGSEAALQQAVALIGPTTVAIDASSPNFQSYKSGIYQCTTQPNLDHAVLVVGYTPTYWIVKNSWGTSWGQQGYIYMARGNGNVANCGITSQASVAYMQ